MNSQETELGQEVTEEVDTPPRYYHNNHNRSRNHSNQNKRYRRSDPSAAGGAGSGQQQRRPQEDSDSGLQQRPPPPQPPGPIPRPAVARYRRQGDSEARIRVQQQRHRQRQQREAERAQQQEKQLYAHDDDQERDDSVLARSASTESGFHTHTDRVEGDDGLAMMTLDPEGQLEAEDETGNYGVQLRPEAEGYTESAEAEQLHLRPHAHFPPQPPPRDPLPDIQNPHRSEDPEDMANAGYSNYVYTQPLSSPGGQDGVLAILKSDSLDAGLADEAYSEPYDIYSLSEHVYEEICDTPTSGPPAARGPESPQQRRAGFQLFEGRAGSRDYHQQEAVGSRLRHYDERSDGESDSPEKEAEFALYPRADSYEKEEEVEHMVTEVKGSVSPHSPHHLKEAIQLEEEDEGQSDTNSHKNHGAVNQDKSGRKQETSPSEEAGSMRNSQEKRDAISLAIKDIKEAIEEVKTRAVRSPYTPDEPKEPIWVMRQDLSPTAECDLQQTAGGSVSMAALIVRVTLKLCQCKDHVLNNPTPQNHDTAWKQNNQSSHPSRNKLI